MRISDWSSDVCSSDLLGLLIAAACNVLVRVHHLAPRLQTPGDLALDGGAGALAPLVAHLLVEDEAAKLHLHFADLVRLRRGDGRQETRHGVERPVDRTSGV